MKFTDIKHRIYADRDSITFFKPSESSIGYYHHESGPVFIQESGRAVYRLNGILHRENGPARGNQYYLNNEYIF